MKYDEVKGGFVLAQEYAQYVYLQYMCNSTYSRFRVLNNCLNKFVFYIYSLVITWPSQWLLDQP